jgi:hypothetical protein
MKKKLIKIVSVLFGILLIALVVVYFMLGSIIKKGVETVGPDLTQGEVKLESASLSILGSGGLKGLLIGNPKNGDFGSPFAFKLGSSDVKVQIGSLMSDKIVVESIIVDGAEVCFDGVQGANHQQLLENIKAYTGGDENAPVAEEKEPEGEGKKVVIKLFKMTNTKILLHVAGFTVPVSLPDFEKRGIGEEEEGASLKDTVTAIYESLYDSIFNIVKGSGDKIKEITGKTLDSLKSGVTGAVDSVKGSTKGAVDKLKGLFK